MTVILVLATFLIFILLDYLLNRKKAVKTLPATARAVSRDVKQGTLCSAAARRISKPSRRGVRSPLIVFTTPWTWPPLITSTTLG